MMTKMRIVKIPIMTLNINDWQRTNRIEDLQMIIPERFLYQLPGEGGDERVGWLKECGSEYKLHTIVERIFVDPVIRCRVILETDEETAALYALTFGHTMLDM